jgi:hypothetical protein
MGTAPFKPTQEIKPNSLGLNRNGTIDSSTAIGLVTKIKNNCDQSSAASHRDKLTWKAEKSQHCKKQDLAQPCSSIMKKKNAAPEYDVIVAQDNACKIDDQKTAAAEQIRKSEAKQTEAKNHDWV